MLQKQSLLISLFIAVLVVSTLIKVLSVWNYNLPFTFDQGRDMIDLRRMVVTHTPRLVGPTTSINGVLLGPFYYYFILPPFLIFGGDPLAIILWQSLWFQLAVIFLWFILKRKSLIQANITGILLLLMPIGFYNARMFFNANLMPVFTILFFATLIWALSPNTSLRGAERRGNLFKLFILGLVSGLSLQIEAAFGILFFPFALLFVFFICHSGLDPESIKIKFKTTLPLLFGFLLTLIPQVLFEFRHGFQMTKILVSEFAGRSAILGPQLDWGEKLTERGLILVNLLRDTNHIPFEILQVIYWTLIAVAFVFFFLYRQKENKVPNNLLSMSTFFIIFTFAFYLFFPQQVKHWYVLGLSVPLVLLFSSLLERIYIMSLFSAFLIWFFLLFALFHTLKAHTEYITQNSLTNESSDPSNLRNEMKAVDWVYSEARGRGLRVYSYVPPIYDFAFQHVFWWYGTRKYGYQPEDIAYLPGQPEYMLDRKQAWTKTRPTKSGTPVYLIIQGDGDHSKRFQEWQGNFAYLCQVKEQQIMESLKVMELTSCLK